MTKGNELERKDLRVEQDIQIDDSGSKIEFQLETWFDIGRKFGVDLSADDVWLNLFGSYDPFEDSLAMAYEVSTDAASEVHNYTPTESEARLIKNMVTEKIQELYNQTPQEFCREFIDNDIQMGGQT